MEKVGNNKSRLLKNIIKKIFFHIAGLSCLFWFIIRVAPAPHRAQYPCQQVSKSIGLTYLIFLGTLYYGLASSLQHTKLRITRYMKTLCIFFTSFILISSIVLSVDFIENKDGSNNWSVIA